jgi:PAS domain S-box-containing protein
MQWPLTALVASTLLSLGISIYFLQNHTSIVFQNLYYIPILIACYFYQKRGFVFSVLLSCTYFLLITLYFRDPDVLFQALTRVGIFIIVAGVITILSQMNKEKGEKIQEKEALFRGIFDTMPSGSAILRATGPGGTGSDYIIEDMNAAALRYENKLESEIIGRSLAEADPVIHDDTLLVKIREVSEGNEPVFYQAEKATGDGSRGYYDTSLFRLPSGEVVSIHTDVTGKKLMEEDLRASEEKFRLAMEATSDGLWDWNMQTGGVYYSPAFAKILGEDDIEPVFESWESRIHPEDRDRTLASLKDHITGKSGRWRIETRLLTADGSWKWVLDRGSVTAWDETGAPVRMIGSIVDISEQKKIEEIIRTERDRAEQYLNIAEVMIVALSREGTIVLINRKGAEMLESSVDDIIGLNWFDTFIPHDIRNQVKNTFHQVINGNGDIYSSYENDIITSSGRKIPVSWINTLIKTPEGQIIGTLSSGDDLTEKKELEKEKTHLLDQIEQNLAQMAYLNDNIRNPLSLILTLSEIHLKADTSQTIKEQVEIIDDTISKLDQRWTESEKVLDFIRKHYQITPKKAGRNH